MSTKKQRDKKLKQSKEILKVLGMPKTQYNDRSGWVFLALADIKPESSWAQAKSPLLPTVEIMQFIREHYKQDYKPNSRETIRRQTLHQFEQTRIVDRNRDDPSRPTNSKDNNYSLSVVNLLALFFYDCEHFFFTPAFSCCIVALKSKNLSSMIELHNWA